MRKILSLYLATVFISFAAIAQVPCNTLMPPEMMNWLKSYKQANPNAAYKVSANDSVIYLPLKVHSVGTDAGGGYYRMSQVLDMLCGVNEAYAPVGWQFYLYQDIDYINSTILDQHTGNYQQLINQKSVLNVANVFFVTNPSGACGYFTGYGGPGTGGGGGGGRQGFVAINKSCAAANNTTVAHELGHFFSLPHIFNGWESRTSDTDPALATDEYVDGSNCATAGDYFCDTRADYLNYRWSCPYNKTKTDYKGDRYNPDGTLYMSYSIEPCATRFSPEQIDAMHEYLNTQRTYMLNIPHDNFPEIKDTAKILFPLSSTGGIPSRGVRLTWTSVPGATAYSVQTTRSPSAATYNKDTIVTDTTVLFTDFDSNVVYRWRVRAYNPGNTCSPYTFYSLFTTNGSNSLAPTFDVSNPSCFGDTTGSVLVNVNGGSGPFSYRWSSGATGPYIFNVKSGAYTVTIVDATTDSAVYNVNVTQPSVLDVELGYNATNFVAVATGGKPGYTYQWTNGATTADPGVIGVGNYGVTVTDANGCSTNKVFSYTAVEELTGITNLTIYPNPAASGQAVTLDMASNTSFNGTVELYDNTGRKVTAINKEFVQGNNHFDINLNQLGAGVYFVKVTGKNISVNRKVVVY